MPFLSEQSLHLVVRKSKERLYMPFREGKPTGQSFGDITAVPTLFLFDRSGKTSRILYGAPPDLHAQVEKTLDTLLK